MGLELINPFPGCWRCGGPNDQESSDRGGFFVYCQMCRGAQSRTSAATWRTSDWNFLDDNDVLNAEFLLEDILDAEFVF
jgi:hypothetical protein